MRPLPLVDVEAADSRSLPTPVPTSMEHAPHETDARPRTDSAFAAPGPAAAPSRANQRELAGEWVERTAAAGWWRDPGLTRTALARHLETSPRTLSRVLND